MKLYHVTTCDRARTILRESFRDDAGTYGTDRQWSGVWLSDRPLDCNEGVSGNTILAVSFDCEPDDLSDYERVQEGLPYREWLIPADFVNKRTVAIVQMGTDIWSS
jgi:hypothetical protein